MADGKRTILPDLRELMRFARGAFCDLDLDGVLERVVAAARHVSSAGYVPLRVLDRSGRELERFVTAGVDEVTRRRIDAPPRERDEQAVQLLAGFAGGGDRSRTPVYRLEGLSLRVAAGHGCT